MPPSAKKANKSQYHLSKADVPNDQKSLQNAMNLHIHILLNATSSLDVPAIPNAATVASFQQMFSSAQDIHNHAANISYNHQDTTANITKLRSGAALQPGSTIAKNIAQVDDHILHTIFSASYLFHYLKEQLQKELKTPGKVAEGAENREIYRRRTALTNNRYDSVRKQGFRRLVGRLVAEEACNSDDEPVKLNNGKWVYYRQAKRPRNPYVTSFCRWVDEQIEKVAKAKGRRPKCDREEAPEGTQRFFNSLPANMRAEYRDNGIALPASEHCNKPDWKTMSDAVFMAKYGNEVLKNYNLPTDAELAQIEQNMADNDGSDGDNEDDNGHNSDGDNGYDGNGDDDYNGDGDSDYNYDGNGDNGAGGYVNDGNNAGSNDDDDNEGDDTVQGGGMDDDV
ncbi:hypothetical protein B0H10DRAFT_2237475 [Mycena sp. CBHHK59/15]|nr:hypothetical protein B0H10DRAFT_2237475 [Mycena sp. CBHHK59/15]